MNKQNKTKYIGRQSKSKQASKYSEKKIIEEQKNETITSTGGRKIPWV